MASNKMFSDLLRKFRHQGRTLEEGLNEALSTLSPAERQKVTRFLGNETEKEMAKPPEIALIGNTGVGKSSTINSLFGTTLAVSHVKACTQREKAVSFEKKLVDGSVGNLILYDMPGLGEDFEADEKHKAIYRRVISKCDVAVWVLDASSRALAYDQIMIRDVVAPANRELVSRLVIGLNQVDTIQPGTWIDEANVPSKTQKESIKRRIADIQEKLIKVVPGLTKDRIVPYSATKQYHLVHLFEAMLNACSIERAWVLDSRKSIADYRDLVDPRILELVKARQKGE